MKKRKITVYFDNAATTFPKPRSVTAETARILRYSCGNPGRSSHRISMQAAETVYGCRRRLAALFGGNDERTVFTSSATHSLNMGIKTALRKGDHVLISDIEHNSVIRPISALAERGLISFDTYEASSHPQKTLEAITAKLRPNTAMIISCHRSNICNLVQPIAHIGKLCRDRGILFLVDASQSVGCTDIDMKRDGIDILCAPGHKGLYGIPGSGFLMLGERFEHLNAGAEQSEKGFTLSTFMEGGNGIRSRDTVMPEFLPERLEAGTLPLPAIGALSAGIDFVNSIGVERIALHEKRLYRTLFSGITAFNDKITVYRSEEEGGIFLFSAEGIPSEEMARLLDSYGICVRAGLHCAPTAHRKICTPEDGAVRVSFGAFNTVREVNYLLNVLDTVLSPTNRARRK